MRKCWYSILVIICGLWLCIIIVWLSTVDLTDYSLRQQTNVNLSSENKEEGTYLWKFSIANECNKHTPVKQLISDLGIETITNISHFTDIQNGDLIFIKEMQINAFVTHILPNLTHYFTLVTATNRAWIFPLYYLNHSDWSRKYIKNVQTLLSNQYLLHWFTENYDGLHNPKMRGIPIGFDFHSPLIYRNRSVQQSYAIIDGLLSNKILIPPIHERILKIYCDISMNAPQYFGYERYKELSEWYFEHSFDNESILYLYTHTRDSEEVPQIRFFYRSGAYWIITHKIKKWKEMFVFSEEKLLQNETFIERSKYVFLLSPFGNGMDCHRTWEGLLFGNIIIVQTSPLDSLYIEHDLPVVIVDSFEDINQTMLHRWYELYKDKTSLNNYQTRYKLTNEYWMRYMRQKTLLLLKDKIENDLSDQV